MVITAADPLNLVGVLTKHDRVPRTASNRVAFLDGVPIAALRGGSTEILEPAPEELLTTTLHRLRQYTLLPTGAIALRLIRTTTPDLGGGQK
jgi:ATP-dependent Lhr-like helicase